MASRFVLWTFSASPIYVEANHIAIDVEGAIILLQSALELLAYEILVEKNRVLSQQGFERLPSGESIRLGQGERILFLKGRLDKGFRDHD